MKYFYSCLIFLLLGSVNVIAQNYFVSNGIRYRIIKEADGTSTFGTVNIVQPEYGEYVGNIEIPNSVQESTDGLSDIYKVVGIDNGAFTTSRSPFTLKLPSSIENIGIGAFLGSGIKQIIIPVGNLKEIPMYAFKDSKLELLNIPTTVKFIGECAFQGCKELKEVTIPNGVTRISDLAFSNCRNLEIVNLPNSLNVIGSSSFYNCSKLRTVVVKENLKSIQAGAFSECINLVQINLPEGLIEIGENAFQNSGLTEIILPKSLKVIKSNAFKGTMLRNINIPQELSIKANEIQLVDKDFYKPIIIDDNAKQNLIIKTVNYSDLKTDSLDNECSFRIHGISYIFKLHPIVDEEYGKVYVTNNFNETINPELYEEEIIIPDLIEILDGKYTRKYLVTGICNMAFNRAQQTKQVRLPLFLERIEGNSFTASGIENIYIPKHIKYISREAFYLCRNLRTVTLPSSFKNQTQGLFSDCKKMQDIIFY